MSSFWGPPHDHYLLFPGRARTSLRAALLLHLPQNRGDWIMSLAADEASRTVVARRGRTTTALTFRWGRAGDLARRELEGCAAVRGCGWLFCRSSVGVFFGLATGRAKLVSNLTPGRSAQSLQMALDQSGWMKQRSNCCPRLAAAVEGPRLKKPQDRLQNGERE